MSRPSGCLIVLTIVLVILFSHVAVPPAFAALALDPWEDEVFVAIGKEYGPEAEKWFRKIMGIILANYEKPIMERLKIVNDTLNNIPGVADSDNWKDKDYWATPFETLAIFGGDCEDIAFAKYGMLLMMGAPDDNLGFAYVETRQKQRHLVLIFRENENSPVYVLDNQVPELLSGPERRDLTAMYI
jgi:predicted transglutaminase-like cysteine proteinase